MNFRAIAIAAPLLALIAAIAIRRTLRNRTSAAPQRDGSEGAPNPKDGAASAQAGETSADAQGSAPETAQRVASSAQPVDSASLNGGATPTDPRLRALGEAIETSYASTVAAFALFGEEADYETHDAQAERDADRVQQLFSAVRAELSPELAESCEAIADCIAAAQLQLMTFAINRKNRGLPDSAQAETELADRKAFQDSAAPLFERIKPALGLAGINVSS